jgi:EEF1A lysine methyltransferase 4
MDMYNAGYKNIVNIDISAVVVRQMMRRYAEYDMDWRQMDICNMAEFRSGSFDVVIDKGTLDAILVCSMTYSIAMHCIALSRWWC